MKEFSADDINVARNINSCYKWIARNYYGELQLFKCEPQKSEACWIARSEESAYLPVNTNMFSDIKWKDDRATLIEDILDTHILTKDELTYMRNFTEPFRDRIRYIMKVAGHKISYCVLRIGMMPTDVSFVLPSFDSSGAFTGMILDYPYSLVELGL